MFDAADVRVTALEALLPVVARRVRRLRATRREVRAFEAQELVQHVALRLLEDGGRILRAYRPDRGASLEGYVAMVTEREVGNLVARERSHSRLDGRLDPDALHDATEPRLLARDLARRLQVVLRHALPSRGAKVFDLVYARGLEPTAAARALGVERQVIYNWQHRIRALSVSFASP